MPNVLGQDLIKEDNKAKNCYKLKMEPKIIVWKGAKFFTQRQLMMQGV